MILPEVMLTTRANQHWQFSGLDSLEKCLNKKHFKSYPYTFDYVYNSRGFRDTEWPSNINQLKTAIWCIGDSFTLGLGCPITHTWPNILQTLTGRRIINVSLDGASNQWISKKTVNILKQIQPECVVIHWSYIHRREISLQEIWDKEADRSWRELYAMFREPGWPDCDTLAESKNLPIYMQEKIAVHWVDPYYTDEQRRRTDLYSTAEEDLENFKTCIDKVIDVNDQTKIIHSVIPNFSPIVNSIIPNFSQKHSANIFKKVSQEMKINVIPHFNQLDFGRDFHHYDIKTATYFVNQLINLI